MWRTMLKNGTASFAALLACTFAGCEPPGKPDAAAVFAGWSAPEFQTYATLGRTLTAAEIGNPAGPLVLIIHGTPGGWDDFAYVLADTQLTARAWVVAVDRLGWGRSGGGDMETSLERQAESLVAVLDAHRANLPAIVVGHSLGGPIAARLVMDHPDLVRALVLVAPSIDPAEERTAWYQRVSRWRVLHWAVPDALALADLEVKPLKRQLETMVPMWASVRVPVTVIQGDTDGLVSPENADFARRVLTHAPLTMVRVPNQGHLIHWQRPDLISDAVLAYLIHGGESTNQ